MSVDLSKRPITLFIEHMLALNPNVSQDITESDIEVVNRRPTTEVVYSALQYHTGGYTLSEYPDVPKVKLTAGVGKDQFYWTMAKRFKFAGGDVTWHARADDNIKIYIDGTYAARSDGHANEESGTFYVSEGEHEVLMVTREVTGPTYMVARFDDGTNVYETDIDWNGAMAIGTTADFNKNDYVDPLYDTSVEVDLIGNGSETDDDFVKFTYVRIPFRRLLLPLDTIGTTDAVELPYSDTAIFNSTVAFSNYMFDTYGINLDNDGITITDNGDASYSVNVDNIIYLGDVTFVFA